MKLIKIISAVTIIIASYSNNLFCCESNKENIDPSSKSVNFINIIESFIYNNNIIGERNDNYFSALIDNVESRFNNSKDKNRNYFTIINNIKTTEYNKDLLKKVIKDSYRNAEYDLIAISSEAEHLAHLLVKNGFETSHEYQLIHVILKRKKAIDFYRLFSLFVEVERLLMSDNPTQKVFMLLARAFINAPFIEPIMQEKINNISFNYFIFHNIITENTVDINLLAYFISEAYPMHIMPWLHELYYFYAQESHWLHNNDAALFGSPELLKKLLEKIENAAVSYDYVDLERQFFDFQKTEQEQHFFESLDYYLITDVNIYWRLIPFLKEETKNIQEQFCEAMLKAGADPYAPINSDGHSALTLARHHKLEHIKGLLSKPQNIAPTISPKRPMLFVSNKEKIIKRRCLRPFPHLSSLRCIENSLELFYNNKK
jgi:hypothetical protein